uniref:Uncharacterized protein n=1 Tax=Candidatus Kentrum sp. MB TaxID=2138164 RepID=A0A450XV84_9GAMM|nr:MAG: hypothetical protein BECKMB1821I_GA0114274_104120 [Candidatus Kentron sp. MB]VFK76039.1 MAG: hypothetical protein BECKMB1821H_GA0114242_103919 [Candidatus Kentron sp. MB]
MGELTSSRQREGNGISLSLTHLHLHFDDNTSSFGPDFSSATDSRNHANRSATIRKHLRGRVKIVGETT